jgi:hypothetical protein
MELVTQKGPKGPFSVSTLLETTSVRVGADLLGARASRRCARAARPVAAAKARRAKRVVALLAVFGAAKHGPRTVAVFVARTRCTGAGIVAADAVGHARVRATIGHVAAATDTPAAWDVAIGRKARALARRWIHEWRGPLGGAGVGAALAVGRAGDVGLLTQRARQVARGRQRTRRWRRIAVAGHQKGRSDEKRQQKARHAVQPTCRTPRCNADLAPPASA